MGRFRIVVILMIIVTGVSVLPIIWVITGRIYDKNEQRAREFVQKIVNSINQHTDYFKQHSEKDAIKEIEENIGEITDNYEIEVLDYEWAYYEYRLTFDKTNKFNVSVMRLAHDNFIIVHFTPFRS